MKCNLQEECYFCQIMIPKQHRMGEIYHERYCEGDRDVCARYRVYKLLGWYRVPQKMYPNMQEAAAKAVDAIKTLF